MSRLEPLQYCLYEFNNTGEILHGMKPNMSAIEEIAQRCLITKNLILNYSDLAQFKGIGTTLVDSKILAFTHNHGAHLIAFFIS